MQLNYYAAISRRYLPFVLLLAVVGALTAGGLSALKSAEYISEARVLLLPNDPLERSSPTDRVRQIQDPDRYVQQQLDLVQSADVIDSIAKQARTTQANVRASLLVESRALSDTIDFQATGASPQVAMRLANAAVASFVGARRELDQGPAERALRVLDAEIIRIQKDIGDVAAEGAAASAQREALAAKYASLVDRRTSIALDLSLNGGDLRVIQRATTPSRPSSPAPFRAGAYAGAASLLLGLLLALLHRTRDDRLHEMSDVEASGLQVLAVVERKAGSPARNDEVREAAGHLHALMTRGPGAPDNLTLVALTGVDRTIAERIVRNVSDLAPARGFERVAPGGSRDVSALSPDADAPDTSPSVQVHDGVTSLIPALTHQTHGGLERTLVVLVSSSTRRADLDKATRLLAAYGWHPAGVLILPRQGRRVVD